MKTINRIFILLVATVSLTANGGNNNEFSVSGGGDIVGNWVCDISDELSDDDMYKGGVILIHFYSDGTMYIEEKLAWTDGTFEASERDGIYRISGDKIISGDGETVKFSLDDFILSLEAPNWNDIFPYSLRMFYRVSDSYTYSGSFDLEDIIHEWREK